MITHSHCSTCGTDGMSRVSFARVRRHRATVASHSVTYDDGVQLASVRGHPWIMTKDGPSETRRVSRNRVTTWQPMRQVRLGGPIGHKTITVTIRRKFTHRPVRPAWARKLVKAGKVQVGYRGIKYVTCPDPWHQARGRLDGRPRVRGYAGPISQLTRAESVRRRARRVRRHREHQSKTRR